MAKPSSSSMRFRLSRLFPSFHSCRSKSPSSLPHQNPNPSPSKRHGYGSGSSSSFGRHVSSSILPCGGRSFRSSEALLSDEDRHPVIRRSGGERYTWRKEEQWHVVARAEIKDDEEDETPRKKIYNTSASAGDDTDGDDDILGLDLTTRRRRRTERRSRTNKYRKRTTAAAVRCRFSTSSAESSGHFSNEEELETLVPSSRNFSTETTSSDNHPRLSVFKKLMPCGVEGKVRESYAVVKKSENPYEDFKRSMREMIVEKKMFEEKDLEQLLQCFLSLNARDHHGVIVDAFTHIWEELLMFRKNWSESDA